MNLSDSFANSVAKIFVKQVLLPPDDRSIREVYHSLDPGTLIMNMTMLATQTLARYMGKPADLGASARKSF